MKPAASPTTLLKSLRDHRLLDVPRLRELARQAASFTDARGLAKDLLQRGWLTAYQVNQLLQGKGDELTLGAYVLLERLGEGGMGQVFKARHGNLDRVVALKVLRKELMARADLVKRFHREIRLVASLAHPNIVLAFDADQVNGVHFLAMEYVEGIDLHHLVTGRGPLPVRDACDFIRQAALGLEHAHDRGLVHRDIKPSNLLRTNQGNVVKVLDLGLARLQESDEGESSSQLDLPEAQRAQTMLTQAGRVMGTPEYIAPEQARNSHEVDGRADLYSLGCTLYHLLAGGAPFAGHSFIEKLVMHQTDTAPAIEEVRPEVPKAVGAIVRKLMAKRVDERYQTAGELAAALAALLNPGSQPSPLHGPGGRRTAVATFPVMAAAVGQPSSPGGRTLSSPGQRRYRPMLALGLIVGCVILGLAALLALPRLPALAWWIEPRPTTEAAVEATRPAKAPEMTYLSDLPEIDVKVGPGKFGKEGNLGVDNRRIVVKGLASPKGLCIHPPRERVGRVSYQIDKQYHVFKAMAALNDRAAGDVEPEKPIVLRVLGDGKELWRSQPMATFGAAELLTVRVTGVERLELVADCPGKKGMKTFPVWVEPYLLKDLPRATGAEKQP